MVMHMLHPFNFKRSESSVDILQDRLVSAKLVEAEQCEMIDDLISYINYLETKLAVLQICRKAN